MFLSSTSLEIPRGNDSILVVLFLPMSSIF